MLKTMMGSPIAWGILSLIAVFSALFAIYTWIAGKKKKQFSLVCKTNEVISYVLRAFSSGSRYCIHDDLRKTR